MISNYSSIDSRFATFDKNKPISQYFVSEAKSLNKSGKFFTNSSNLLKINKFHFSRKFQINLLKKSRVFYDLRANPVYLPVKKETIIGISSENLSPVDILLQNSSKTQIVIRQVDDFATIFQKKSEVLETFGARIEIKEATLIRPGDIFRIGKTNIRIYKTFPILTLSLSKSKKTEEKISEIPEKVKFFYMGSSEDGEVLFVEDRMVAPRHVLVSKDLDDWKFSSIDDEFKTWKYLVSMQNKGKENSEIHSLKAEQLIHFGGSRISLVKDND